MNNRFISRRLSRQLAHMNRLFVGIVLGSISTGIFWTAILLIPLYVLIRSEQNQLRCPHCGKPLPWFCLTVTELICFCSNCGNRLIFDDAATLPSGTWTPAKLAIPAHHFPIKTLICIVLIVITGASARMSAGPLQVLLLFLCIATSSAFLDMLLAETGTSCSRCGGILTHPILYMREARQRQRYCTRCGKYLE